MKEDTENFIEILDFWNFWKQELLYLVFLLSFRYKKGIASILTLLIFIQW